MARNHGWSFNSSQNVCLVIIIAVRLENFFFVEGFYSFIAFIKEHPF